MSPRASVAVLQAMSRTRNSLISDLPSFQTEALLQSSVARAVSAARQDSSTEVSIMGIHPLEVEAVLEPHTTTLVRAPVHRRRVPFLAMELVMWLLKPAAAEAMVAFLEALVTLAVINRMVLLIIISPIVVCLTWAACLVTTEVV